MGLRDSLNGALKEAMKAKDARRVGTLRMVLAAIKDRDIAARTEASREPVSDEDLFGVLSKMIKQREESAVTYAAGGRPELAEQERAEIDIIREFLPRQMDEAGVHAAIEAAIAATGASSMKDMGAVMAHLKERHAGTMDFAKASAAVKARLSVR
ncbi:MAG: GatB/YqeY domain-containing protein [Alphaproteobacteria bacterium]|nr:GatB/YqeY domain-containing protein [Alphaproteobacteria bacterium]